MEKIDKYLTAFKRLNLQLDEFKKKYRKPKCIFLIHAAWCHILYGATPNDYIHFEFYKLKHCERKQYITHRKTLWLEKKLNDKSNREIFDNKYEFNKTFKDFIKREWIYLPESTVSCFKDFVKKHKKVIVKPINLSSGKGITIYQYINDDDAVLFYNKNKDKKYLIEEVAQNHEDLKRFNDSSVNTIRIYTLVEKDQQVSIVGAVIRIGAKGACVDNYHSGGVAAAIDIDTGIIFTSLIDISNKRYVIHPTNKSEIIGKHIPNWDKLKETVIKAAKVFPTSRYIGWDICITPEGFEFIEGNYNANPDLLQNCERKGKYYLLKKRI